MRVFVLDQEGGPGLDIALRALYAGHSVLYWLPSKGGEQPPTGRGLVDRVSEWEPQMDWADLIILTGNSKYAQPLSRYFGQGYPIFGANLAGAELELNRGAGQEALRRAGVKTIPYSVVSTPAEAIEAVVAAGEACVLKPWGGSANKAMTCVCGSAADAVFQIRRWQREGLFQGQLMIQEKIEGIEMGIAGWFGPGGWANALEESFEHKKFLNDDLGCNTGEMGTVIRHVKRSKLFEAILEPMTDYLHQINYVGDCNVNCIIDGKGRPWPLEFTMRLGWPDFAIRQPLIKGDPVQWMKDLLEGNDTLKVSTEIACGVVMAHGDFPSFDDPDKKWSGYPIRQLSSPAQVAFQQVMMGDSPHVVDGKVIDIRGYQTAGNYVMIAIGTGEDVRSAAGEALAIAKSIHWPSNIMYRTDIGDRLRSELNQLHRFGYAVGMEY